MKLVKLQSLGARNAVKQKEPASFLILYVFLYEDYVRKLLQFSAHYTKPT